MTRALRLHERHSREELAEKVRQLSADPANHQAGELQLLTPRARRLRDGLLLAIYWYDAPKGNTRMARAAPQTKWW